MGKITGQGLEALAVRRATVTDADKVRYRVYRSADDFIAVIAESALMAVKVSGIDAPYRIVRDLPTEGIAIRAERMAQESSGPVARVALALEKQERKVAFAPREAEPAAEGFVPMKIRDLEKKRRGAARILTPQQLEALMISSAPAPAAPEPAADHEPEPALPVVEIDPLPAAEPDAAEPAREPEPPNGDTLTPEQVAALLKE